MTADRPSHGRHQHWSGSSSTGGLPASATDGRRSATDEPRTLLTDGGRADGAGRSLGRAFDPEELRRRNPNALAIDVLYLFTTAFLATLLVRGFWPAVIATFPLATMLYFAWKSTTAFLVAQIVVIVATIVATYAGLLPL